MSEIATTLVISIGILAVMVLTQFGPRQYTWHRVLLSLVTVAAFGWSYLRHLPTSGNAIWLYAVGILIGGVFAALATAFTGMERDSRTGRLFTLCGTGFVVTWVVAVALRIAFVLAVDNVSNFREQVVSFMLAHQLVPDSIAPFFVLMALTTVVGRVVALRIRASRIPAADRQPDLATTAA